MKVKKVIHKNVDEFGFMPISKKSKATSECITVGVDGGIGMSDNTFPNSNGYWINIALPRTKEGIVEVFTATFANKKEMDEFFKTGRLKVNK